MQGYILIADWSVAHIVVIMNDVMNDNMAAFAHVGARLGAFFYWTRWRRGVAVERRTRDREVVGSSLDRALRRKNSGQVSHT